MNALHPMIDAPLWAVLLFKITAILAAAWAGHAALKWANPRWRVLLWRVTAVGLVVLPGVTLLLPGLDIRLARPVVEDAVEEAAPVEMPAAEVAAIEIPTGAGWGEPAAFPVTLPEGFSEFDREDVFEEPSTETANPVMETPAMVAPDPVPVPAPVTESPEPSSFPWFMLPPLAWLAGVALLALRLCLGHRRLGALANRAKPAPRWVRDEAARVAEAIGCRRRVDVVRSRDIASPVLCGLRRPLLVLPSRMCNETYRGDLPAILAHELAHSKAYDVPWNAFLQVLTAALWFHPLVWRIRKAHLAACELVSDAASASFIGDVAGYCRTLARVAVDAHSPVPASGIAMARTSAIGRRLSALKRHVFHLPLRRRSVLAFGVAAFLGVAVLGAMRFALAEPTESADVVESVVAADEAVENPAEEKAETPEKEENAAGDEEEEKAAPEPSVMRVKVLDPEGKPLPGAEVRASIWTDEKDFKSRQDYKTGANGIAEVRLPRTYRIVRIGTGKSPFVGMFSRWEKNELAAGAKLPEEYTVRLETGVSAGGRIVNEAGEPIAGVKVEVMGNGGGPDNGDARTGYDIWLATGEDAAVTDQEGRWRIDGVPNDKRTKLRVRVFHPDYVSDDDWGQSQDESEVTTEMLLDETAVLTLRRGVVVEGRVTDPEGKPVAGAVVARGEDPRVVMASDSHTVRTDAQGVYRIPALPPGPMTVTVMGEGFAPDLKKVEASKDLPPVDFQLKPGKVMRLRFINESDEPVPGVSVQIVGWRGGKRLYNDKRPNVLDTKIPIKADKDGVWEWTWAPDDSVKLRIGARGDKNYASREIAMSGGDPPRTITLKPEHRITGSVTDAVTGKPIPAFNIVPIDVSRKGRLYATRANVKPGKDGRLDYLATRTDVCLRLRVEAVGHRTQTGPEFRVGDDTPRTQNFRLRPPPPPPPSDPITGVVLDPGGQPVPKAKVLLAIPGEDVNLNYHDNVSGTICTTVINNHATVTDTDGRFSFPDPDAPFIVAAMADGGFATARFEAEQRDIGPLRMHPWASVKGRLFDGGRPVKGAGLYLSLLRPTDLDEPRVDPILYQIATDKDGCFEFTRVPPGPVSLRATLGPWREEGYRSGPRVCLDLQPGQNIELELGKPGATVEGKVCLTGNVPPDLDCTYSINNLVPRSSQVEPPASIVKMGLDILDGWQETSEKTDTGRIPMKTRRRWFVKLKPDGSFRISGVPAGEYDLSLEIYTNRNGYLVEPLVKKTVRVTVTEEQAADGTLKLPEIEAEVKPIAAVGQTPSLKFTRPDGTDRTLANYRGRYVVVHFWASWCGSCKKDVGALWELCKQSGTNELFMLGLSLDEDAQTWKESFNKLGMSWAQGRLVAPKDSGVSTVPTYWLLDPEGKIIAKAFTVDRLREEIEKVNLPEAKKPETPSDGPTTIRMKILDAEGKPVPGVKVKANYRPKGAESPSTPEYETDQTGIASFALPRTIGSVHFSISKKACTNVFSIWTLDDLNTAMKRSGEVTVRIRPRTTAGGRIVDKQGKPIAGAEVQVSSRPFDGPFRESGHGEPVWSGFYLDAAKTDADGRWRVEGVADDPQIPLSLRVSHGGYATGWSAERLKEEAGISAAMLLDETAVLSFDRSLAVEGRVTDPDGKPIDDAIVVCGERPYNPFSPTKVATGADGRFKTPPQRPGRKTLTVVAPDGRPKHPRGRRSIRPSAPGFSDETGEDGRTAVRRFQGQTRPRRPGGHRQV